MRESGCLLICFVLVGVRFAQLEIGVRFLGNLFGLVTLRIARAVRIQSLNQ